MFYNEIQDLIDSVEKGQVISDGEIIEKVYTFIPSYSCEPAAQGYVAVVSSILYFRPSLEHQLLKKALEPLYFLGIEKSSDILDWVESYITKKDKYLSPSAFGMIWLDNFHTKKDIVDLLLDELRSENM